MATGERWLVWGELRGAWPEPLGAMVREGRIRVEGVGSVHELAAGVVSGGVGGVVLDGRILGRRDFEAIKIIRKRVRVAMVMLPVEAGTPLRVTRGEAEGILSWQEAGEVFAGTAAVADLSVEVEVPNGAPQIAADNEVLTGN